MTLKQDIKRSKLEISEIQDQKMSALFKFPKELDLFSGHFPGNPILPGIVQIEMIRFALEESMGRPLSILSIKKTKFAHLIDPDTPIRVSIHITPDNICDEIKDFGVKATLKIEDTLAGKINLQLRG